MTTTLPCPRGIGPTAIAASGLLLLALTALPDDASARATRGADPGRVLLVDDDNNDPDVRAAYTDALDALSVDYDVWDTGNTDLMEPDAGTLAGYETVIWFSGGAFTDPPPGVAGPGADGEAALDAFLDAGGCFLLSSQDYIFDHADDGFTDFMTDRLGIDNVIEDVEHDSVTGEGVFAGIGPSTLDFPTDIDNFTDEPQPDATAEVGFRGELVRLKGSPAPVTSIAALTKADGAARASFWGFPFEALPVGDRGPALTAFFEWCASDPGGSDPRLAVTLAGGGSGTVTSSPAGIDCGTDCSETYPADTVVTLTAAPDPGSTFAGWSGGGCSGTGACAVTLSSDTTVVATFTGTAPDPTLAVTLAGTGAGTVNSSPAGIDCGTDCSESYAPGTRVVLTAVAAPGSAFTGWSGGGCSGTGACEVTLSGDTVVAAVFSLGANPRLTVVRTGLGLGRVTSTPVGIDCGTDCAQTYPLGTRVTLTAIPDPGSVFAGWSGGGCAGIGPCELTLTADASVAALFSPDGSDPTLTVARTGTGTGTVTSAPAGIDCGLFCSETYPPGTLIVLTAAADPGSTFTGWSGGCSGTGACAMSLASSRTVTAKFTRQGSYPTLVVSTAGSGAGTVISAPRGILCGDDCSSRFPPDTFVRLEAVPAPGSRFAGWGGDCGGMTCGVPLSYYNQSVIAIFEQAPDPCPGALCLNGDRFAVDVVWRTPARSGVGTAVPFRSDDTGILWFFTEDNWEMLVKVLDGCNLNGHFWVYAAAGTNLEYTLTVTDRVTGRSRSYFNPPGNAAAGIADNTALAVCGAGLSSAPARSLNAEPPPPPASDVPAKQGSCVPGPNTLCLGQGRFAVEVDWRTEVGGAGPGKVVPSASTESGLFYFFTSSNWEMLVKVLDGCGVNQRYWVYAAVTTDVGYTLRVTDTETGEVREYFNPVGRAAPAITDSLAFATCP